MNNLEVACPMFWCVDLLNRDLNNQERSSVVLVE